MTMGLPLEAPKEATRGWDVPTLKAGVQGLNPDHAPKLGLFCRYACPLAYFIVIVMLSMSQHCQVSCFVTVARSWREAARRKRHMCVPLISLQHLCN